MFQTIQEGLVVAIIKYNLNINQHNIKPHLDIEQDIQKKKDGLFTFTLRINQGNIEDYAKYRTRTFIEYRTVTFSTIQKSTVPPNTGAGSSEPAIRPDNR